MSPGRRVYLDYNATAPVRADVRHAIEPILFGDVDSGAFGNPSSVHWAGQSARKHLEAARTSVAKHFGRKPGDIIFTSGGSEADNLALFGVLFHPRVTHRRLITTAVEHPAILAAAAELSKRGVEVERIPVDREGRLDLAALERALERPAGLVSVIAANNETGVCTDLGAVIERARTAGVLVHVDAVQAAGRISLPAGADLISISGHKLGGIKGAGALVTHDGVALASHIVGGPQERGRRAGTESVAAIVSLGVALDRSIASAGTEQPRLRMLRNRIEGALTALPGVHIVAPSAERLSNTTTVVFEAVDGDAVLQGLDLEGIAASSGSACSSGSLEPSHVLLAMGFPADLALSSVRFSLGWATSEEDIDVLCDVAPRVLERARSNR